MGCSRTHCMCTMFPSAVVYASASHSAMHTPVDVTGIEPAKASLQNLGLPNLLSAHPTILFWLGNLTQWRADGRPLLAWCQRFSGCTPRAVKTKGKGLLLLPLLFTLLQRRTCGAE